MDRRSPLAILAILLVAPFAAVGLIHAIPALTGSAGSYVVLSGSMIPTFSPGDLIFTHAPVDLQVGDVITFHEGAVLVTHRIVEVVEDGSGTAYRTRGDNNGADDPLLVPASRVVGRYAWHIPSVGFLIDFAQSKWGRFLLLVVPSVVIIATEGRRIVSALNRAPSSVAPAASAAPPPAAFPAPVPRRPAVPSPGSAGARYSTASPAGVPSVPFLARGAPPPAQPRTEETSRIEKPRARFEVVR